MERVPVAVNCWVLPCAIDATAGETEMLTSTAVVTVSAAVPEMRPEVAVMVVAPVPTPVATPWEPDVFDTVAVAIKDEDHVTESVMLAVVRFEYVPVAVNDSVLPCAIDATAGVTEMLRRVAAPAGWLVSGSMAPTTTVAITTTGRMRVSNAMPRRPRTFTPEPHV